MTHLGHRTSFASLFSPCVLALCACAESTGPSRALVRVEAEPAVRASLSSLHVHIVGADQNGPENLPSLDETLSAERLRWPIELLVAPRDEDVGRTFRVTVRALDGQQRAVATVRAEGGYLAGRTVVLSLRLEDACLGVMCSGTQTCSAGRCTSETADAGQTADAGAPVPSDSNVSLDAGMVAIDACTLVTSYPDRDGDGFGDTSEPWTGCSIPSGNVAQPGDCDDSCTTCRPGGLEACEGTLDEDCDGTPDNGCECFGAALRECGIGVGACTRAHQLCVAGLWLDCPAIKPSEERCNEVDDDCDGATDEGACEMGGRGRGNGNGRGNRN